MEGLLPLITDELGILGYFLPKPWISWTLSLLHQGVHMSTWALPFCVVHVMFE